MNATPPPLDPTRYRSAAAHYEQGRVPYPPALIRRVAEATGLARHHRVLDLGCGPAPLARGFAPYAGEVLAMDPTPEMLTAARALATGTPNIRFLQGSSYDLGPQLGSFHLVVMGRSFHWMDRVETLRLLDHNVGSTGAVVLFHDTAAQDPANAWRKLWRDIRHRYEADDEPHAGPNANAHSNDPNWIRHEAILLGSAFSRLERFGVIERRAIDIDTLVQRTLSMSPTSPSRLGDKTEAMIADLRASLANVREEVVETDALVAWRPDVR